MRWIGFFVLTVYLGIRLSLSQRITEQSINMATVHPSRLNLVPQESHGNRYHDRDDSSYSRRRDDRQRDRDDDRERYREKERDNHGRDRGRRGRSRSDSRDRDRVRASNRRQSPDYSAFRPDEPPHVNGDGGPSSHPRRAEGNMYPSRDGRRGDGGYNTEALDFFERCVSYYCIYEASYNSLQSPQGKSGETG